MFKTIVNNTLTIVPSVMLWELDGRIYFDRKFHDGILSYCDSWGGSVSLLMRIADTPPPEFGLILFDASIFPARLTIIERSKEISYEDIKSANIILASADNHKNLHLSSLCKQHEIKCVYIIEYILETRIQIVAMSEVGIWQKIKSLVWNLVVEFKRRSAFSLADGMQANGSPAYNSYSNLVNNALLYFDSRNCSETNITQSELDARLLFLDNNEPLRLGFSGRLIHMKGAVHLIEMAKLLKEMDVSFTLDIFGTGELKAFMEDKICDYKLENYIKLRGNVDFNEVLLPFIKANLDVFVCCHRQSDPSCTYLETYACGVPIVGYANRAHQGILEQYDVGWSTPINDVKSLANKIFYLNSHRDEIKAKANNALSFSANHTFEKTFNRRIEQCSKLVKGN